MELRQVRHFVAAAEALNISRAAARVGLSQPALTRSIKALEAELETRLFERDPRGCTLTHGGVRFLEHAQEILNACGRAGDELSALRHGTRGRVRFGLSSELSGGLGERALDRLMRALPDVRLQVFEGFHEDVVAAIQADRIDFALTTLPPVDEASSLIAERLRGLRERVFAGATHPFAVRSGLGTSDLAAASWVIADCRDGLEGFRTYFAERQVSPPPAITTNSLAILKSLLISGSHLSLLADHVVDREVAGGLVERLRVPPSRARRSIGLLYSGRSEPGGEVSRAMGLVRDCCRNRDGLR